MKRKLTLILLPCILCIQLSWADDDEPPANAAAQTKVGADVRSLGSKKTDSAVDEKVLPPADTKPNPPKPIDDRTSLTPPPPGADLFPPAGEKPKPPSGEPPLTVYEQRRRTAQEAERIRRENLVRDAQNARLVQERSLGHVESSGEYGEFVPDTVLIPVNRVSPELAQRLREVRRIAEDPRVPASLGNQAITLLLSIDPEFTNVGPIVVQAERVLEAGGARKYLTGSNPSSGQSKKEIVSVTRETTEITQTGKAYRQDDLLAKFPNVGTTTTNTKTGDVNVYIGANSKSNEDSGNGNGTPSGGNPAGLSQNLADQLRSGLTLRKEEGEQSTPSAGTSRTLASSTIHTQETNSLLEFAKSRPGIEDGRILSPRSRFGAALLFFAFLLAIAVASLRAVKNGGLTLRNLLQELRGLFFSKPPQKERGEPSAAATQVPARKNNKDKQGGR